MRATVTVVIRINAVINFRLEDSVIVQSVRGISKESDIHVAGVYQGQEQ